MLTFRIVTVVPEAFPGILGHCLAGKAMANGLWSCETFDIKECGVGKYRKIDDRPFGGGSGMIFLAEVVAQSIDRAVHGTENPRIIYMSARGKQFNQDAAKSMVDDGRPIIILCGRFEGVDQRVINLYNMEEWCIGDFVLSGGELAAMALMDACVRLVPGVVGNADSATHDSFSISDHGERLIEFPHYTRPRVWRDLSVPETLCSGDHAAIQSWRMTQARAATIRVRPDLLKEEN